MVVGGGVEESAEDVGAVEEAVDVGSDDGWVGRGRTVGVSGCFGMRFDPGA